MVVVLGAASAGMARERGRRLEVEMLVGGKDEREREGEVPEEEEEELHRVLAVSSDSLVWDSSGTMGIG